MDDEDREGLLQGTLEVQCGEPSRGYPTRRGLALADLVAIDQENVGAGAAQLACDGEPGEARSADEHIAVAVQRRALGAALGRAPGHVLSMIRGSRYPPKATDAASHRQPHSRDRRQ